MQQYLSHANAKTPIVDPKYTNWWNNVRSELPHINRVACSYNMGISEFGGGQVVTKEGGLPTAD